MRIADLVERLRRWCHSPYAESAQDIMEEAANEIELLRLRAAAAKDEADNAIAFFRRDVQALSDQGRDNRHRLVEALDANKRLTAAHRYWQTMYDQNSAEPQWMDRSKVDPPDPHRQCLLFTNKLAGFIWVGRKGVLPADVSHWMYLPDPPVIAARPPEPTTDTPVGQEPSADSQT